MEIEKNDEILFEQAIKLKNKGLYKESLGILLSVKKKYNKSSVLNGLLATTYYFLDDYERSAFFYKKASVLNPKSELASLGLFHSLWERKNYIGAYRELNRFLSSNEADRYKTTLKELYEQLDNCKSKYQRSIVETYYKKYFDDKG